MGKDTHKRPPLHKTLSISGATLHHMETEGQRHRACLLSASAGEARISFSMRPASTPSSLWLMILLGSTISILLPVLTFTVAGAPGKPKSFLRQDWHTKIVQMLSFL